MEKLINILKTVLSSHRITDIIQVGERELNIIVSTKEDAKDIQRMADLIHDDSEVKIKGVKINFVDQYGTKFERV
ncbi:hypothetical protein [Pedobacter aquatilis]|uniref:hypothetical protein n=1 Tax=Pedobacter aquatilis TaxID=351343 RepID=UPI00292CCB62|nr:hypothetical protein [Pedobacter aquatilis]